MELNLLKLLYQKHKEPELHRRYIHSNHIINLLEIVNKSCHIEVIGQSVLKEDIYSITIGSGQKKILMWSQMHGNESTTTKAIFDLINVLSDFNMTSDAILKACTIKIIPILNPDGAKAYTRFNANQIDLNRDAQDLSQPESLVLRDCFNSFKPDFCYNLHGQRTIFSAGNIDKPATVSFLAPAQDELCSITTNRKRAMEIISVMNASLQKQIPGQVGIYDDAFNINCVGDTFQSYNIPTILFEAGHFKDDYERENVREFIFQSLYVSLNYITNNEVVGDYYQDYFGIPKNEKLFFDIILKNAQVGNKQEFVNIAIQYQELLSGNSIKFMPKIEKITNTNHFFGHREIDVNGGVILTHDNQPIFEGYANDFVVVNNEELSLILTKP